MAQTKEGAIKIAAGRLGITADDYKQLVSAGRKWCSGGKHWELVTRFVSDSSRPDGLTASCSQCRNAIAKSKYVPRPKISKKGARFVPVRDGDKLQARARANRLVAVNLLPNPNDVPCFDCEHLGPDRRHEYDHYKGYAAQHQEDVQAVCSVCHKKRHRKTTN